MTAPVIDHVASVVAVFVRQAVAFVPSMIRASATLLVATLALLLVAAMALLSFTSIPIALGEGKSPHGQGRGHDGGNDWFAYSCRTPLVSKTDVGLAHPAAMQEDAPTSSASMIYIHMALATSQGSTR
jgi:hypothetical protein